MITEKVYSPYKDEDIRKSNYHLLNSKIWETCFKEEEVTEELKDKYRRLYEYSMKFMNTIPVQVTKIKTLKCKR